MRWGEPGGETAACLGRGVRMQTCRGGAALEGGGGRGRRKGLRGRGETGSHRRLHSEQQQLGAVRLEAPFFLQS